MRYLLCLSAVLAVLVWTQHLDAKDRSLSNRELTKRLVALEQELTALKAQSAPVAPRGVDQKLNALRKTIDSHAASFNSLVDDLAWGWSPDKKANKGAISAMYRLRHAWSTKGQRKRMSGIRIGPRD